MRVVTENAAQLSPMRTNNFNAAVRCGKHRVARLRRAAAIEAQQWGQTELSRV